MSKTLDVAMAGIIAGIVAYATARLGIGGTVIGAVLGAILYQIMTHLFKAPLEGIRTQNVEARIVYTIPLILIVAIEILFVYTLNFKTPVNFFYILENATENNLFRYIGTGLIIMGLYPIIQPENIKKLYGYIIIIVGIIVLLGGFADFNTPITDLYSVIFSELGSIISLMVIFALSYVIIAITKESVTISSDKGETDFENYEKIKDEDVKYNKKLDYWFKDSKNGNDPKINNDDDIKRDHDMR